MSKLKLVFEGKRTFMHVNDVELKRVKNWTLTQTPMEYPIVTIVKDNEKYQTETMTLEVTKLEVEYVNES